MKIINLASGKSAWLGYEYYQEGKVLSYEKIGDGIYHGKVSGSGNNVYDVVLDVEHPRKTTCNCPFADGRRVICKHAAALYFAIFPDDALEYKNEVDSANEKYEEWLESRIERVIAYVRKLSKKQLQDDLLEILLNSDTWIFERYVRDHYIED